VSAFTDASVSMCLPVLPYYPDQAIRKHFKTKALYLIISNTKQMIKKILVIIGLALSVTQLKAQSIDNLTSSFNTGHYYKIDGTRVESEIKLTCLAKFGTNPHNSIYIKGSDGKTDRLTTKEVSSFVIGADSFLIAKNIKHGEAELTEDFVHFDSVDGDITTVTHYTTTGNSTLNGLVLYVKKGVTYATLKAAQKAK